MLPAPLFPHIQQMFLFDPILVRAPLLQKAATRTSLFLNLFLKDCYSMNMIFIAYASGTFHPLYKNLGMAYKYPASQITNDPFLPSNSPCPRVGYSNLGLCCRSTPVYQLKAF